MAEFITDYLLNKITLDDVCEEFDKLIYQKVREEMELPEMIWNVYRYNFNAQEIEIFNVFDHIRFANSVKELLKEYDKKEDFEKKLNSIAMYNFWSKCEYEIVITSWPPYISKKEIDKIIEEEKNCKYRTNVNLEVGSKIDIYQQLKLNWEHFVDYVWSFK